MGGQQLHKQHLILTETRQQISHTNSLSKTAPSSGLEEEKAIEVSGVLDHQDQHCSFPCKNNLQLPDNSYYRHLVGENEKLRKGEGKILVSLQCLYASLVMNHWEDPEQLSEKESIKGSNLTKRYKVLLATRSETAFPPLNSAALVLLGCQWHYSFSDITTAMSNNETKADL